jgi:hypothetical protein
MENNEFRLPISKEDLGEGDWIEMLSASYDANSDPEDVRVLYVARFGVFKDPKSWGRMLASMVRTLASGEAKFLGVSENEVEKIEAQIAEGFNDVLTGEDTAVVRKRKIKMLGEPQPPDLNWNPNKKNWPPSGLNPEG